MADLFGGLNLTPAENAPAAGADLFGGLGVKTEESADAPAESSGFSFLSASAEGDAPPADDAAPSSGFSFMGGDGAAAADGGDDRRGSGFDAGLRLLLFCWLPYGVLARAGGLYGLGAGAGAGFATFVPPPPPKIDEKKPPPFSPGFWPAGTMVTG